jgi:hypothetical protein
MAGLDQHDLPFHTNCPGKVRLPPDWTYGGRLWRCDHNHIYYTYPKLREATRVDNFREFGGLLPALIVIANGCVAKPDHKDPDRSVYALGGTCAWFGEYYFPRLWPSGADYEKDTYTELMAVFATELTTIASELPDLKADCARKELRERTRDVLARDLRIKQARALDLCKMLPPVMAACILQPAITL